MKEKDKEFIEKEIEIMLIESIEKEIRRKKKMTRIKVIDVMSFEEKIMTVKEFEKEHGTLPFECIHQIYEIRIRHLGDEHDWMEAKEKYYSKGFSYTADKIFGSWRVDSYNGSWKLTEEEKEEIKKIRGEK